MDIETLKTFVEVAGTRHFAKAAENLFVTQAAVSARIAQLENRIGARVFTRARNNIQLTAAGHRLFPHAETILGAWNRALVEVSGPEDAALLTLGCMPSIGEMFLDRIIEFFRGTEDVLLQVEQLSSVAIASRVRERSLSLGLVYEPPRVRDLEAEHVADLDLPDIGGAHVVDDCSDLDGRRNLDDRCHHRARNSCCHRRCCILDC